jgi:hypothetical protein
MYSNIHRTKCFDPGYTRICFREKVRLVSLVGRRLQLSKFARRRMRGTHVTYYSVCSGRIVHVQRYECGFEKRVESRESRSAPQSCSKLGTLQDARRDDGSLDAQYSKTMRTRVGVITKTTPAEVSR